MLSSHRLESFATTLLATTTLLWTVPSSAQSNAGLGAPDIQPIINTYRENEIRFKRDYVGKQFSAVLPFFKVSEGFLSSIDGAQVQFANDKVYCFVKSVAMLSSIGIGATPLW